MSQPPSLPRLAFSPKGQQHLLELWQAEVAVEQAWKGEPTADKAELLTRLQTQRESIARFHAEDFSELLLSGLLFEPVAEEYRLSWADDSLRLQATGGFDVRLTQNEDSILLEGRRRPAFHLYEYLTSRLGPGRSEDSRIESAEGLQLRRRDAAGGELGSLGAATL